MKKYGQSIIEYVMIAVLVILGVVIMGTYVLRSTNAHFKIWDEGVRDSFQEVITQAPQSAVPFIATNCLCNDTNETCGAYGSGIQCADNERIFSHSCLPQGCDGRPLSYCKEDDSCCTTYYKEGCGNLPDIATNKRPPSQPVSATGLPGSCHTYYSSKDANGKAITSCNSSTACPSGTTCSTLPGQAKSQCYYNTCYYGEQTWGTQCSDLPVACCTTASCDPHCSGVNLMNGSVVYCPASPNEPTCPYANGPTPCVAGLTTNNPITYVDPSGANGSANCTTAPCEGYCNEAAGYFPNKAPGTNTIISCINDFTVAPNLTGSSCAGGCAGCGAWDVSGNYGCRSSGKIFTVTNNCSFSICPTESDIEVTNATANPTQLDSSCTICSCCTDIPAGYIQTCLANQVSCDSQYPTCQGQPDSCAGQNGPTPSCQCQVGIAVKTIKP